MRFSESVDWFATVACLAAIAGLAYLALLMEIPVRLIVLGLVGVCVLACSVGVLAGFRARRKVDKALRTLRSHDDNANA